MEVVEDYSDNHYIVLFPRRLHMVPVIYLLFRAICFCVRIHHSKTLFPLELWGGGKDWLPSYPISELPIKYSDTRAVALLVISTGIARPLSTP